MAIVVKYSFQTHRRVSPPSTFLRFGRMIFWSLSISHSVTAFPYLLILYHCYKYLRDILVKDKHRGPPPLPQPSGTFRRNRNRCKTCRFITERTTSPVYTFLSTNEERRIRHHIFCSSLNLFNMIQCCKCKVQYIKETKRHLSDGFGEQKSAIEKVLHHHHSLP